MKKILFILIWFVFAQYGFSHTYYLNNGFTDGQTITTCSGTFIDAGGASANYTNNELYTVTFQPTSATQRISIYFGSFAIDNTEDRKSTRLNSSH